MNLIERIEDAIGDAIASAGAPGAPPGLAAALRHAVFPGGARVRPRLCFAVAAACGNPQPEVTAAAAVAIELLHCASLVHDDLPCFDDAALRRGKASVHHAYGEQLAVLAGDALIVLAFQTLAVGAARSPALPKLITIVAQSVGMPGGIVAGQAWECEPRVPLTEYQRAKTGALFVAATSAGAVSAGSDPGRWQELVDRLGEAYQVADDIRDVAVEEAVLGKPAGRDAALGRPSAAREFGLKGAIKRFEQFVEAAVAAIPDCAGAPLLRELVRAEATRLVPEELLRLAA